MDILRDFLTEWFISLNLGEVLSSILSRLSMILVWLIWGFIVSTIASIIHKRLKAKNKVLVKRQKTITALVVSIVKYIFWFVMIMMILQELNIDLTPILASAGILGFAVGFGAQELIKDLISGFFIIFERAFDIGDVIEIGGFKGTVLEIGIRKTKILNWKNEVRLINNGDIRTINQFSLFESIGVVEFQVSKNFDIRSFYTPEFEALLEKYEVNPYIKQLPKLVGVIESGLYNLVLRVTFVTDNGKQHELEREIRRDIELYIKSIRNE